MATLRALGAPPTAIPGATLGVQATSAPPLPSPNRPLQPVHCDTSGSPLLAATQRANNNHTPMRSPRPAQGTTDTRTDAPIRPDHPAISRLGHACVPGLQHEYKPLHPTSPVDQAPTAQAADNAARQARYGRAVRALCFSCAAGAMFAPNEWDIPMIRG
ncbi:hypothetical protein FRC09_014998, partial [Ceratobasidium sp. 395]